MRVHGRRVTRLINALSKKVENHAHAISLHFMHYMPTPPDAHQDVRQEDDRAMAAGVADHPWSLTELVELLDQLP